MHFHVRTPQYRNFILAGQWLTIANAYGLKAVWHVLLMSYSQMTAAESYKVVGITFVKTCTGVC
mgnify:CR=1 FL=1|jgi:hypothetical protein